MSSSSDIAGRDVRMCGCGVAPGRLSAVLVTFRRPEALRIMLGRVARQHVVPERLVVVDNSPTEGAEDALQAWSSAGGRIEYVSAPENLGPAGAIALGMDTILASADDDDWILLLDDDDPPESDDMFGSLLSFAREMRATDPATGAVGLVGARFDRRKGRVIRVRDEELVGPVAVDYIGGGQFPLYRVGAVRIVGRFAADLFFGFDDLDYGLRLRAAGYSLYGCGPLWHAERARHNRLSMRARPRHRLAELSWRRYYSLRNLVRILRQREGLVAALRVTLVQGLLQPAVNLPLAPIMAWRHLALNFRACADGWLGRMGRTLEPDATHLGWVRLATRSADDAASP